MSEIENTADVECARSGSFDGWVVLIGTCTTGSQARRTCVGIALNNGPVRGDAIVTNQHISFIGDAVELTIAGLDIRDPVTTNGLTPEGSGQKPMTANVDSS